MLRIDRVRLDGRILQKSNRYRITENKKPVLSWSLISDRDNRFQKSFCVRMFCDSKCIWDSGVIDSKEQKVALCGEIIVTEHRIELSIDVTDNEGETAAYQDYFFVSQLSDYCAGWITSKNNDYNKAMYFKRDFNIGKSLKSATMYVSGIGFQEVTVNGIKLDNSKLEPPVSDYTKTVYYVMYPETENYLRMGKNSIGIIVGNGWRNNYGQYLHGADVEFFGSPQLSAILHIEYEDGSRQTITADESWVVGNGAIVGNSLFNGEIYNADESILNWDLPDVKLSDFSNAKMAQSPGGTARTATFEPVTEHEIYTPKVVRHIGEAVLIDFGQNIAGVCRIKLPENLKKGQRIIIRYAEDYDNGGELHFANLRCAESTDVYIASGDERDLVYWQPRFTYHGFRYVLINGLNSPDICAVSLYNDLCNRSFFNCGSAIANAVQKAIIQTEKSNMHNLLTDCPQRDERMGWMNDATVRFEEIVYNFETAGIFEKVLQDITDTQSEDGSITCTAPFIYGFRPADPVCSAFLVAGMQELLHIGNKDIVAKYYKSFEKWEQLLQSISKDNIVYITHYGDWASPVYACKNGDKDLNAAQSACTPGEFMSSCFYYYNAVLLNKMAILLEDFESAKKYELLSLTIKDAILKKWWNDENGTICTGSQGCQSMALHFGIIPENYRSIAVKRLADDLISRNLQFTTGNICTRYLFNALCDNGYTDLAWELFTKESYPSIGYMLQNDATTIWERLELKRLPDMNSYNHPMYGACGQWLYEGIAGIRPIDLGFRKVLIKPNIPKKLLFAESCVDTAMGCIWVKWFRRFGKCCLHIGIPFGVNATVDFGGNQKNCGSGEWHFEIDDKSLLNK